MHRSARTNTARRPSRKASLLLILLSLFLVNPFARPGGADEGGGNSGAGASSADKKYITMNFREVDLQTLIKFMSDLTGRNFLVDPAVKGHVTVLSPSKVTVEEAYRVFLSILEVHGFTTVESGKITKILPSGTAKTKGTAMRSGDGPGLQQDSIITQLAPLKTADPDFLAKVLTPLVEKTGAVIPYADTRTLILIDTQSNVNRLLRIIRELDVPGDEEVRVFPLRYASAEDLSKQIASLFDEKGKPGKEAGSQRVRIVADARTNSLVVRAAASAMTTMEMLVGKLDPQKIASRENVHLYELEYALAEDLAKVLMEMPEKAAKDPKEKATAPSPFSRDTQIYADKATNTLIVMAKPEEYQILEEIIRRLDRPRTMVYVEAVIMEVSATKALELGIEWRVANTYDGGFGAGKEGGVWFGGSTGPDGDLSALTAGVVPPGFAAGVIGKGITLGSVVFPTVGAFLKAVQSDSHFNIISTPQILTLDNEDALIEVGQNIPFVTRVDAGTAVTDRAIQSFQYNNVGITLKVTPHISQGGLVRMKIEESVKSVLEKTALGGTVLAPTTTFRNAKTSITVKDGETAVIGGLIENRLNRSVTQTPCLGGIPGLGWLFRSNADQDDKANLMVFLTPHIVGSSEKADSMYRRKKEGIDQEAGRTERNKVMEYLKGKGLEE